MQTIRRIYLYLISAISLIVVTWSIILLARLILSEEIGQGQIIGLATWLAAIIVGLPIFLFHWLMAQRLAAKDEKECSSMIRGIYFLGMMAVGATPIISNIYRLIDNGLPADKPAEHFASNAKISCAADKIQEKIQKKCHE